jgi:hypothetical protein
MFLLFLLMFHFVLIFFLPKGVEFVFVSACHSEEAGKAFVDAGVPHVVAVRWDTPISDKASQVFSKQFYLSLLVSCSIVHFWFSCFIRLAIQFNKHLMSV